MPTPTGTLQGVAAASWDGSVWQPAGRTMASVGTPTGVLRGVAPFSWDGAAWQPAGGAGPGVPTPSGTLDGVAVYGWNGSAWAPNGGGTTPTPSGTLQGVAGFTWDGTAWQPAGRAAPEVATPYGVLAGVAMFGWSGTAWTPAPGLDLNFLTMAALDPRITFTRASVATYFDPTGTMRTAGNNVPRFDYDPVTHAARGLLVEESRINLSQSIATGWVAVGPVTFTQGAASGLDGTNTAASAFASDITNAVRQISETVAAAASTAYTVSVYVRSSSTGNAYIQANATGGATAAGVAYFDLAAGTAVVGADLAPGLTAESAAIARAGNWWRISYSFTTASTTTGLQIYVGPCVTVSASGDNRSYTGVVGQGIYVWGAQCEAGAFPTSYVPTTTAAVTRAADTATLAAIAGRNTGGETFNAEFVLLANAGQNPRIVGSAGVYGMLMVSSGQAGVTFDGAAFASTANIMTFGVLAKMVASWATPNAGLVCLNGGSVASSTAMTNGFSGAMSIQFMGDGTAADIANGYIRRFRYWPRVLSNAEMQQVTT